MPRLKNILSNVHAYALLLLSFYLLFVFLASGHGLNLKDFAQIKLFIEVLLFFFAAILLISGKKNKIFGNVMLIIVLILVQLSFIDFYIEISEVEYGAEKPVIFLTLLFLLFVNNIFFIYININH